MIGKECYVFENEQTAINAEAFISGLYGFPKVGRNQKTKELKPNKQQTIKWANVQQRITDGKYFFEVVPPSLGGKFGVLNGQKFENDYPHTIETFSSDWLPNNE